MIEFIYQENDQSNQGDNIALDANSTRLRDEYVKLGKRILTIAITSFNRLILYARVQKGQYWLKPRQLDLGRMSSDFAEFKAKIKIADRNWIRLIDPSRTIYITVSTPDKARFISESDWPEVVKFVQAENRPSLIFELLANAEDLAGAGYRRNAIIEAIVALEITISEFSKSPQLDKLKGLGLAERLEANSLKSRIDHLGFSTTFEYLIPLLFSEEILPTEILNYCKRAIQIRQNVVHQGQRDVDPTELVTLLQSIRQACSILMNYTDRKK